MGLTIGNSGISGFASGFNATGVAQTKGSYSNKASRPAWQIMPGGFMIITGDAPSGGNRGAGTVYFPISFPNACLSILLTEGGTGGWIPSHCTMYAVVSYGTTSFTFSAAWVNTTTSFYQSGLGGKYMAVGY